jgi:hypothetical protein
MTRRIFDDVKHLQLYLHNTIAGAEYLMGRSRIHRLGWVMYVKSVSVLETLALMVYIRFGSRNQLTLALVVYISLSPDGYQRSVIMLLVRRWPRTL